MDKELLKRVDTERIFFYYRGYYDQVPRNTLKCLRVRTVRKRFILEHRGVLFFAPKVNTKVGFLSRGGQNDGHEILLLHFIFPVLHFS